MKKYSSLLIISLCALLLTGLFTGCSPAAPKEQKIWIVGTSPDYQPYESVDEKGEYVGFDMDLIRIIAEKMGVELEIKAMEFDSLIAAVKEGKIDAVIACLNPTPSRLQEVDFTVDYYDTMKEPPYVALVKPNSGFEPKTMDDLLKGKVAVQTGAKTDEWITGAVKDGKISESNVQRFTDANVAALDVQKGRVDAFVLDQVVAIQLAEKLGLNIGFTIPLEVLGSENPGVVLKKGNTEMLNQLNTVIEGLKADGTIKGLEEKWLKTE